MKKNKEMVYKPDRVENPIVLAEGVENGHEFLILNLGTHPCCYIKIPESSKLKEVDYDDIPLRCHGGLTFSGELNGFEGHWIGWDFAHSGDYMGYNLQEQLSDIDGFKGHKWTTEELLSEVWSATYDLKKIRKLINLIHPTEEVIAE